MPPSCTVLIAAPDYIPALKQRVDPNTELLVFSDSEALEALDAISRRRPQVVTLERLFAATSRGAALINRIKADPALASAEIRIVSHDGAYARVSPRPTPAAPAPAPAPASVAVQAPSPVTLDQRGTRRAPRFRIADGHDISVDGNPAAIIDLSTIGAQVLSPTILRPKQRVRMALADDFGVARFNGAVAWASFEMPKPKLTPHYRAGIEFADADPEAVEAYCLRHRKQ